MCQRAHDPTVLISRRETRLEEMFVCPRPFSPSRAGCAAHVWPTGYVARARLALRSEALRKGAPRLLAGLRTPTTQRSFPFPLPTPLSPYFNTTFNHSCQMLISTLVAEPGSLPGSRSCARLKSSTAPQPALLRLCFDSPRHDDWISRRPRSDKG